MMSAPAAARHIMKYSLVSRDARDARDADSPRSIVIRSTEEVADGLCQDDGGARQAQRGSAADHGKLDLRRRRAAARPRLRRHLAQRLRARHDRPLDTAAAAAHPGVIAVYTGAEFRDVAGSMPHGGEGAGLPHDMAPIATPILAHDCVRHVGEPVAVVVDTDRYGARDALEKIEVDYEPLETVVDLESAVAPAAAQLYDEVPGNVAFTWRCEHGDPAGAFAAAEVTLRQRMGNQRLAGVPMEPRGCWPSPMRLAAA